MSTEKQIAANRANALKSTGPKSDAGKKRSSLNAVRHGLTGQVVVLPEEDIEAYNRFTKKLIDSFNPFDPVETQLAQQWASLQWRLNRVASVEDTMLTVGIMEEVAGNLNIEHPEAHNAVSNARTFRDESASFDRISLYNQRLLNGAAKVLKQLQQLQAERRLREQQDLAEAARLYQYHRMQSLAFDPRQNGFDFSLDQIHAHVQRETLHTAAVNAQKLAFHQNNYIRKYGTLAA